MIEKVKRTIKKYNMLNDGDEVLVGLSGGADSVALLLVLKRLGYSVTAIHINHNLRGKESKRDEEFCIKLCKANKIKLFIESVNVRKYCKEKGVGIEEGARILRYNLFDKYSKGKIATAHNANDALETMIFNITRGSSLKGVCSIPPVRDNIIRPLIEVSRSYIEDFLEDNKQSFIVDSTNLSTDYTRNKIRLKVIPKLKKINENVIENSSNLISLLRDDEDYLQREAKKAYCEAELNEKEYDILYIFTLENAIKNRVLVEILKENDIEVSKKKLDDLISVMITGKQINIKKNVYIIKKEGKLIFKNLEDFEQKKYKEKIEIGKKKDFFTKQVMLTKMSVEKYVKETDNVNKKLAIPVLDYGKIDGNIILKNRSDGEKIRLLGRDFQSKIKKLFNENVKKEERDYVVILSDDEGPIFVEGFGISDRVKVDENSDTILMIEIS